MRIPRSVEPLISSALPNWDGGLLRGWLCMVLAALVFLPACTKRGPSVQPDAMVEAHSVLSPGAKPADDLRARLSPLAYAVTQEGATEPPFANAYWDEHRPGIFVDVVDGTPLFSSADKFDSGTGWPSFSKPLRPESVEVRPDHTSGTERTEVRSAKAGGHLGHVFDDGPGPTHLRYCINSAALRFVRAEHMEAEGFGAARGAATTSTLPSKESTVCAPSTAQAGAAPPGCRASTEVAILAGGCFWGMEEILRTVSGVLETSVGYTGGVTEHPTYDDVHTGRTGHAEAIRVIFDPEKISFRQLLDDWFFRMHDPSTLNRQGNDRGTQYRSAIFATSEEQLVEGLAAKARAAASGRWKGPVVTEVSRAGEFTRAESEHQRYLEGHPGGYTCHFVRD